MSFLIYDLIFLVIFAAFLFYFLYSRKHNLKREGLLILYKAEWGIKLINFIGKKFPKTLNVLSYISIATGYVLMIGMFYLLGKIVYLYTNPIFVQTIKIPPLLPLLPYLPQAFGLDFLPPFYFTYWILIIAIILISHEFAHGIFAAHNNVKIKSTGFAFLRWLPVFFGAFVELDEKTMEKKSKFSQLVILSAGTFANLLTAILFFAILWIFFSFAFTQSGIVFDGYAYTIPPIAISAISSVNGIQLENPNFEEFVSLLNKTGSNEIEVEGEKYVGVRFLTNTNEYVQLYYDAPAINAELESVIFKINGVEINNIGTLQNELLKYSPGDRITLNVLGKDGDDYNRDITLGENPENKDKAWLGIGFSSQVRPGVMGKIFSTLSLKEPHVYYKPLSDASLFFYDLLWWTILISLSVALINMLPVGIFDGGRFFYLTILAITKKEKIAKNLFAFSTFFILFIFLILMLLWVFLFF